MSNCFNNCFDLIICWSFTLNAFKDIICCAETNVKPNCEAFELREIYSMAYLLTDFVAYKYSPVTLWTRLFCSKHVFDKANRTKYAKGINWRRYINVVFIG